MTQKRIDLTQFEEMDVTSMPIWYSKIPDLIAELKRCYERLDVYREELEAWLQTAEQCGWTESIRDLRRILNASE